MQGMIVRLKGTPIDGTERRPFVVLHVYNLGTAVRLVCTAVDPEQAVGELVQLELGDVVVVPRKPETESDPLPPHGAIARIEGGSNREQRRRK